MKIESRIELPAKVSAYLNEALKMIDIGYSDASSNS